MELNTNGILVPEEPFDNAGNKHLVFILVGVTLKIL
jgi:hypothetical protein